MNQSFLFTHFILYVKFQKTGLALGSLAAFAPLWSLLIALGVGQS